MNTDDVLRVIRALEACGYLDLEAVKEDEMAEEVAAHLKQHPTGLYPQDLPPGVRLCNCGRRDCGYCFAPW